MASFVPQSITLKGTIRLSAPVDAAFPMFSPMGEKLWVPGWNPELLFPLGATWEEDLIFRTQENSGTAVWIVTKLDMSIHEVVYRRIEPDRYVARIEVHCRTIEDKDTEAVTQYSYVGLSESGNRDIAEMTQDSYDEKMTRWANWLNRYFESAPGRIG